MISNSFNDWLKAFFVFCVFLFGFCLHNGFELFLRLCLIAFIASCIGYFLFRIINIIIIKKL